MASIIERLAEKGIGWAALSCVEVEEAVRVCHSCADTPGRAFQALSAYLFVASLRSTATATARATDAYVASMIPKTRGEGNLGADAYRKQVKPLLVAWGLLSCSLQQSTGNGRKPTVYGFPMFEKLLAGIEPTGQDASGESGCTPLDAPFPNLTAYPSHPDN